MAFYATRGIQFTTLKFKSYSNNLKEEKKREMKDFRISKVWLYRAQNYWQVEKTSMDILREKEIPFPWNIQQELII